VTTIGKVWTAGIAYVALAVGAGLSIMYNILDTMQVRGPLFDWADLVTAIAAPGMVVLMVEVFVSRWWIGLPWHIQLLRWSGVVVIGGVAMRASWTHGHDWMAGRGQAADVAMMWPLAIDLLAIMATALILTGRTRGHVATDTVATDTMATDTMATDAMATDAMATATQPLSPEYAATLSAELDAWGNGVAVAIEDSGQSLATEAEIMANDRYQARRAVPAEAAEMILFWDPAAIDGKQVDALMAAYFGKSARTARRWRSLVTGQPTSGGG